MNWDALGQQGEIVEALAVLATLYYLTLQIKIKIQNKELDKSNEHARAQLAIDVNNCYINNFDAVMCDNESALIYQKGLDDDPLDKIETIQFSQFINRFSALLEAAVTVAKHDMLMSGDYTAEGLYDYPHVNRLLTTKVGSEWFKQEAPLLFSEEFLDNIRKSGAFRLGQQR